MIHLHEFSTSLFYISIQKQQSVAVLQMKRSNIITIALSRLPPPRHLPPAIYSMDSSVLGREDIQVHPPYFIIVVSVCTVKEESHFSCVAAYLHFCPNQRLQTIVPTQEEFCLINEAKAQNPSSPLAPAEQCLLTLGQIPHLSTRLQLWAFILDYDSLERVRSTLPSTLSATISSLRPQGQQPKQRAESF